MSKFINKETIEYLKSKQGATINQQVAQLAETLSTTRSVVNQDLANTQEMVGHLGTQLMETQRIVDSKYQELVTTIETDLRYMKTQIEKSNGALVLALIGAFGWLITLSILILRKG